MSNKYISYLRNQNCYEDLKTYLSLVKNTNKEITEAMAIIKTLRTMLYNKEITRDYTHVDLCSGNGLVGVLSAFLIQFDHTFCTDITPRNDLYNKFFDTVRNFDYVACDMCDIGYMIDRGKRLTKEDKIVYTCCHGCGDLSEKALELATIDNKPIVIMPCCNGNIGKIPRLFNEKLTKYERWCYHLYKTYYCDDMWCDKNVISPKNILIKRKERNIT